MSISALWTQMSIKVIPQAQGGIADGIAIGYPKMHIPKGETDGTTYIQSAVIIYSKHDDILPVMPV